MQLTTTRKEASDYDTIEKPQPHTTRVFWISHTLEERMEMRESVSGGRKEGGAVKKTFSRGRRESLGQREQRQSTSYEQFQR